MQLMRPAKVLKINACTLDIEIELVLELSLASSIAINRAIRVQLAVVAAAQRSRCVGNANRQQLLLLLTLCGAGM